MVFIPLRYIFRYTYPRMGHWLRGVFHAKHAHERILTKEVTDDLSM